MSDNGESSANQTAVGGAGLVDSAGTPVRTEVNAGVQQAKSQAEEFTTFVREQPLAAVLIGVMVGYLLGKIT